MVLPRTEKIFLYVTVSFTFEQCENMVSATREIFQKFGRRNIYIDD